MRTPARVIVMGTAVFVLAVLLSGCDNTAAENPNTPAASAAAGGVTAPVEEIRDLLPADVLDSNLIQVGSREEAPPGTARDSSGKVVGYEVDLMTEISHILGVDFEYSYGDVGALIPGLQANRFQAANGAFGTNAERQEVADFVNYAASPFAYVAVADRELDVSSLDDLCGLTVATANGTQAANVAAQQVQTCADKGLPEMVSSTYANTNENLLALKSGRADIYFTPSVTALTVVASDPTIEIAGVDADLPANSLGVSFLKGSPLPDAFAAAINYIIEDEPDVYAGIFERWDLPQQFLIEHSEVNPSH
ncbi:transporter substrate-binding domain-containing protein [Compostimonas suwonensis]|uniref:Polar amino acid transport system substrate-binding protein n=1 Tax=Compostimonas suwonensis TaxID=1048394 RepID=A0A2M9C3K8_9MICO|nr:transporter substrate-binding domain-containing protein [Compostimonas suwonensis]PJJ65098.1 polar amino acid transport system substrate-binding protein [Compostimonas suwonensis]